ncbi:LPS-assembly lipoprotein [Serratia symbiotica str. 'Cinara cedri']|nr:LPS-assembly lipoprotein [Serratia symbiotica str. 'Cinara cedri']
MKTKFSILLVTIIWTVLYSQHTLANLANQCMLGISPYDHPVINTKTDTQPITIDADKLYAQYPQSILFTGNVNIKKGNNTLIAQQVKINQIPHQEQKYIVRTVTATGDVHYSDPQVFLIGRKAWLNLNTKDTDIYKGYYHMVGRQGRGIANKIKIRGANRYTIIENGTFTSCLPGDDSWIISGSKIIHDRLEQLTEVWNAKLHIGGIPVFYSPYIKLPIGDKRRSGFLIPNAKYGSNNNFEFILPYYWNIAVNYDATVTPHYMSGRGLQWQNEFRYLIRPGVGLMELDWLPADKEYKKENPENNSRWLFHWNHTGLMNQMWRFNINLTKVSDTKYFTDLDSKYGSTSDGYTAQKFSISYTNENLKATLSSKQFQIFGNTNDHNPDLYKVQPQLDLNYYKNNLGPFNFHIFSQIAKFHSLNPYNPNTTRWHIEPTLHLPLINSWFNLYTEAKILMSHYQQNIPNGFARNYTNLNSTKTHKAIAPHLDSSVNRVIPQFKADGKLVFERPIMWSKGSTHILETHAQYLYVPYLNQSNIYTYDTTLMQTDYYGLFRDRIYSGLDRIVSQNHLSGGLTTRIYDVMLVERFNASVGQIYYFNPSNNGDCGIICGNNNRTGNLAWVGDTSWYIDDHWSLRCGVQYHAHLNKISLGNGMLKYNQDSERILQINYRYASPKYIQAALNTHQTPAYQHSIAQVGVIGSWPIARRWVAVGAYYYDAHTKESTDQLLGMKYNTCCWAATLGYERKITDWNHGKNTSIYENKISFNIELRGLSNEHNLGSTEILRSGILSH